jgi:hypothetical protein
MELIADILLAAGALGAGLYCFVLGRRLNRFNDLEKGVGGAVAVLSAQVDDLTKTLTAAQTTAGASAKTLTELTARAEDASRQLELQMASLHDLPQAPEPVPDAPAFAAKPRNGAAPPPPAPNPTAPMFTRSRTAEDAA